MFAALMESSSPFTSQYIRVDEKKNHTLREMDWCMKIHSIGLDEKLYAKSVNCASYIFNYILSKWEVYALTP
jgi:hypothetical protein